MIETMMGEAIGIMFVIALFFMMLVVTGKSAAEGGLRDLVPAPSAAQSP